MLRRLGAAAVLFGVVTLAGTWAAAGEVTEVAIRDFAFSPAAFNVTAGTTVTWTNFDAAPHTVTSVAGPVAISSPQLARGQSWSFTFDVPGTYRYYCAVHPDMTASVLVTPRAAPTAVPTSVPVPRTDAHGVVASGGVTGAAPAGAGSGRLVAAPAAAPAPAPGPGPVGSSDRVLLVVAGLAAVVAVASTLALGGRTG